MKVQLLYAWQHYGKREIIDLPGVLAEAMIRNGQAAAAPSMGESLGKPAPRYRARRIRGGEAA